MKKVDEFTTAYIECALWSTNDNSNEQGGDPLDKNYGPDDIASEALESMIADCKRFQEENFEDINDGAGRIGRGYSSFKRAGHDFWLTRNGHGAGFWDGDWEEKAVERLTKASKAFGEANLYVGDNGAIELL